jgi:hypothetical protein
VFEDAQSVAALIGDLLHVHLHRQAGAAVGKLGG